MSTEPDPLNLPGRRTQVDAQSAEGVVPVVCLFEVEAHEAWLLVS